MNADLKSAVRSHWEEETCGTRYGEAADRREWFREVSAARYGIEPYIAAFADFPSALGKDILEIGVGAGADFENWCAHARHTTGIAGPEGGRGVLVRRSWSAPTIASNSSEGFTGLIRRRVTAIALHFALSMGRSAPLWTGWRTAAPPCWH